MKQKCRALVLIGCLMLPFLVFAQGSYTKIESLVFYSEYYPNANARFKGTIVFENGSGAPLTEWTDNQSFFNCAKEYGNLFLYDRSGLGKSTPDLSMSLKKPMTAKLINEKLVKLLKKKKLKPPYILVAHSYGALYAGYFARKFPKEIKGMLLIDPVPVNYQWSASFIKHHQLAMKKMRQKPSKELYQRYGEKNSSSATSAELFYQLIGFEQTKVQLNAFPKLSSKIPVIIVSSADMEKGAPIKGSWYQQQHQWLNQHPDSKIFQVRSGHFIQIDRPKVVCHQLGRLV